MAIFVLLASVWLNVYHNTLRALPPVKTLESYTLSLPRDGRAAIIGHDELSQSLVANRATQEHLALWFDAATKTVFFKVRAPDRKVDLTYGNPVMDGCTLRSSLSSDQFLIEAPTAISLGVATYAVRALGNDLHLTLGDEALQTPIVSGTGVFGLRHKQTRRFVFGGRITHKDVQRVTPSRLEYIKELLQYSGPPYVISNPDVPERSLSIAPISRSLNLSCRVRFFLDLPSYSTHFAARSSRNILARATQGGKDTSQIIGQSAWPHVHGELGTLERIVIGRTTYTIAVRDTNVTLTPIAKNHWAAQDLPIRDGQIFVAPQRRGLPADDGSIWSGLVLVFQPFLSLHGLALLAATIAVLAVRRRTTWTEGSVSFWAYVAPMTASMALAGLIPPSLGIVHVLASEYPSSFVLFALGVFWTIVTPLKLRWKGIFSGLHFTAGALLIWLLPSETRPLTPWSDGAYRAFFSLVAMTTMAACILVWRARRPSAVVFWFAFMVILIFGTIAPAQLALGHGYSQFIDLYGRHLCALALSSYFIIILANLRTMRLRTLVNQSLFGIKNGGRLGKLLRGLFGTKVGGWLGKLLNTSAFLFVGVVLAFFTAITDEGGSGGFQPSELNKSFIILGGAYLFVVAVMQFRLLSFSQANQKLIAQFALYLFIVAGILFASMISFDMSPIIIVGFSLLFVFLAAALIFCLQTLPARAAWVVACIPSMCLLAGLGLSSQNVPAALAPLVVTSTILLIRPHVAPRVSLDRLRDGNRFKEMHTLQMRRYSKKPRVALQRFLDSRYKWSRRSIGFFSLFALVVGIFLTVHISQFEKIKRYDSILTAVPIERLIGFVDARLTYMTPALELPDLSFQVQQSRVQIAASGCGLAPLLMVQDQDPQPDEQTAVWVHRSDQGKALLQTATQKLDRLSGELSQFLSRWLDENQSARPAALCTQTAQPILRGETSQTLMKVPALQDDFAATFLIASFGLDSAFFLLAAQVIFLLSILATGTAALIAGIRRPRLFDAAVFGSLALFGFGATLAIQMIFAWSNALGLLPVFGQPMTFLSLGASHHFLFATPAVVTMVVVSWSIGDPTSYFDEDRDRIQRDRPFANLSGLLD